MKVANVEIKHVDLDESMVRAIARQAEAERTRRAKIINAEGEQQAAQKLVEAAQILAANPGAMQLRYLGALSEIAGERSSTIVFPFPIELLKAFGATVVREEDSAKAGTGSALVTRRWSRPRCSRIDTLGVPRWRISALLAEAVLAGRQSRPDKPRSRPEVPHEPVPRRGGRLLEARDVGVEVAARAGSPAPSAPAPARRRPGPRRRRSGDRPPPPPSAAASG